MPGMMMMIPKLFAMFYTTKGRNQEGAPSVDGKTTSFKKLDPNLRLSASVMRRTVTKAELPQVLGR